MSELPLIIVNPTSANNSTRARWPGIAAEVRHHFGPFQCQFTERAGDAKTIAACEAKAGRKFIIACGGDGTISDVANGIVESGNTETELGLLPSGTGGDFRRTLNIPNNVAEAAVILRQGRTKKIDVGRVTYTSSVQQAERTRYFVNVVSCGMAGDVVQRVKGEHGAGLASSAGQWLGGKASFAVAALQTTLSFAGIDLWLQIDEQIERRLKIANLSVANARFIGGGMKMAPEAVLDDGYLDLVVVGDLGARKILANAYKLYRGSHLGVEQVHHIKARRLSLRPVESTANIVVEVDGELDGYLPASFDLLPRALRVRCPVAT